MSFSRKITLPQRIILITWFILGISAMIYFLYRGHLGFQENLRYNFSGYIQNVNYDVKGFPEITVHDKKYYLGMGYNFDNKIEKGDSIIKHKGSSIYKLIKKKTGDTLIFDN